MDSLPNFVKLAESFGLTGLVANKPGELDKVIEEMIVTEGPVIADIRVDPDENVFPMIPAGSPHYDMLLGPGGEAEVNEDGLASVTRQVVWLRLAKGNHCGTPRALSHHHCPCGQ